MSWPHFAGVALMLGIFAAWAIPCLAMMRAAQVTHVWSSQFTGRMSGDDFKFATWILNLPRGLVYMLPWAVLLPFARFRLLENETDRTFCRGLSLGIGIPFLIVSLLPSALPRYNMPLLAPAIWLLAILIREHALLWPKPLRKAITWTVLAVVAGMLIYTIGIIPFLRGHEKVRPLGEEISAALPPNETLYAVDPDYQPFLFYVRQPIVYVDHVSELPLQAHYLLVRPESEAAATERARPILRLKDYRGKQVVLLRAR